MISELFTMGTHEEKVWIVKAFYCSNKTPFRTQFTIQILIKCLLLNKPDNYTNFRKGKISRYSQNYCRTKQ